MNTITLNKIVNVHPSELKNNIKDILISKCDEQLLYQTDKDYGYIKSIKSIESIKNNRICQATGYIIFNIEILCNVIKPENDMVLNGCIIIKVMNGCIQCKKDCLDIVIMKDGLKNIEIIDDNKFMYYDEEFEVGEDIDLKIIQYLYTNSVYKCICEII